MTTKRILRAAGLAAALAALCGCAEKKPVLHVYTWSDYIKPELVQQFERENNCKVVIDTYASNEEMYAKLKAGATGYD
ncbi:MAG TPA: spermidine/putrescine ABC transporter substrate-binding protein, partial [Kiritimatiellia bacterium]|nr:spermidine/putrescine ABC transporter substrate-binding protein [Kiritimatiellia bacterium]